MNIFNNREISIAIWLLVGLIALMFKPATRKSIVGIIRQFFHPKILIPYILAVIYTLLGVFILSQVHLWTSEQIKDTILWSIFTLIKTMLTVTKAKEDKNYFKDAIKEVIKLSIIIEFVTEIYTFSLAIELIVVPIAILIGGMQAVATTNSKYISVRRVLTTGLIMSGLFVLGRTIYEIVTHISEFASFDTLREFLLSPFLAIWILPFIYIGALYITYENGFLVIGRIIKNKTFLTYAKWQAFIRFNIDTNGFERWRTSLFIRTVETKKDLLKSINKIKALEKIEINPPPVPKGLGWSPYAAKDFLLRKGIETGYYKNSYELEWLAASKYVKLDSELSGNTIAYYVNGFETVAKTLELALDVRFKTKETQAINFLLDCANSLYELALNKKLPTNVKTAILERTKIKFIEEEATVSITRTDWSNSNGWYTLIFLITHKEGE